MTGERKNRGGNIYKEDNDNSVSSVSRDSCKAGLFYFTLISH